MLRLCLLGLTVAGASCATAPIRIYVEKQQLPTDAKPCGGGIFALRGKRGESEMSKRRECPRLSRLQCMDPVVEYKNASSEE